MTFPWPGAARRLAVLAAVVGLVAMGCATDPTPTATPSVPAAPATLTPPSVTASPMASPLSSPERSTTASTEVDASLLDIVPDAIEGAAVVEEPEAFAEATRSTDFVANVAAAAFPFVADGGDWASGVVARLRNGVYSDVMYRAWRDSYDEGACAPAGGVTGHAEAELGGRTVHITRCAEGLLVYHAYLAERGVIVSLFSIGERRFGEQLMKGLRP